MKSIYTLVGMKYKNATEFVASLPRGEPLLLARDSTNDFDPFAVQVWARDRHVGFVKATEVRPLAQWLDRNGAKMSTGFLAFDGDRWPKIEVEQ